MLKEKLRSKVLNGCLNDSRTYLYGCYKGFYLTIQSVSGQYIIRINVSSPFHDNNAQLNAFLQRQMDLSKRILAAAAYPNFLNLTVKGPALAKNIPDTLNSLIDPIMDYLVNNQYHSGCEYCGTTEVPLNCYEINERTHYLCDKCKGEIHTALQEKQEEISSRKSNPAAGLAGAFLGSLIGCILWVLIYRLGYIAGLAGAVTAICAMKGYELFGGHLDRKGVIGSVLIMILMIYFANRLAWSWEVYDAFKEYGISFSDAYRSLSAVLTEYDLTGNFYGDLAVGYLLTAVASFRTIVSTFKASTGSFTIKQSK